MEKYRVREDEAGPLSDFLLPMLEWYPDRRATAEQMLEHPWLSMPDNYDYKMTEKEHSKVCLKKPSSEEEAATEDGKGDLADSDLDLNAADVEDNETLATVQAFDRDADDRSDDDVLDPATKKYSLQSDLLNVDHGANPQFQTLKQSQSASSGDDRPVGKRRRHNNN